jgi:hypothetical protein
VAHGKTEPCCARRSFRAVDRPCTWPSPAQGGIVLDMNSSVSPITASKRGVSGTAITLHLLSSAVPVQPAHRNENL